MGCLVTATTHSPIPSPSPSPFSSWVITTTTSPSYHPTFLKPTTKSLPQIALHLHNTLFSPLNSVTPNHKFLSPPRLSSVKTRASLDKKDQNTPSSVLAQEEELPNEEVEESVKVLKKAAKTRKVGAEKVLTALSVLEKAKLDPSCFLDTLGGTQSPGRTWMLIFTAEKQLRSGKYFPITAVQRFDAAAKRIENGVYLGPIGRLTFEGRFSWNKRILAFTFERIRIKLGTFNPFEISFGGKDEGEPSTKDPFFIWFYVDEEIAVARGRSGGTAFWCRCRQVSTY